jgi:hypothetical protein
MNILHIHLASIWARIAALESRTPTNGFPRSRALFAPLSPAARGRQRLATPLRRCRQG